MVKMLCNTETLTGKLEIDLVTEKGYTPDTEGLSQFLKNPVSFFSNAKEIAHKGIINIGRAIVYPRAL